VKYSIPLGRKQDAMMKDRSPGRGLPDNISTIEGTELMEGPRDEDLNNNDRDSSRNNDASSNNNNNNKNKTATTVSAQSNEILNVNTANHNNNIQKNGSTTTKCATQVQCNQAQQNPTTSTFNNTAHTHSENPTQNINTDDQSNYTPHKKHGVIFEAVDGFTIEEYLRKIADTIGGRNIKYASRLSGGRICVYLGTEALVKQICTPGGISINDTFIQCRPYIIASKRVVLSNVLPDIPDESLIPSLLTFGKTTSPISKLSISTTHPDLKHIKTFRRLVCMIIPHMEKMPDTFNVEHDGVSYAIYVTSDDVTYTNC
jgi:hypothetical protein